MYSFLEYNINLNSYEYQDHLPLKPSSINEDTKPFIDDFLNFMNPFLDLQKNKMYAHRSIIEILNTYGGIYLEDEYNIDRLSRKDNIDIQDFLMYDYDESLLQVRKFRKYVKIEDFVRDLKRRFLYGFYDFLETDFVNKNSWTLLYPGSLSAYSPIEDDSTFRNFGGTLELIPLGDIILQKNTDDMEPDTDIYILNENSLMLVKMHILITKDETTASEVDFLSYQNLFFVTFGFECPEEPKEIFYYNHFKNVDQQQKVLKCLYTNNLQCFNKFCLYRFYEQHHFNGLPYSFISYNSFMNFTNQKEEIFLSFNKWLNGDLINYCLNDWNEKVDTVAVCSSEVVVSHRENIELIKKCRNIKKNLILIPFNPSSHWVLLALWKPTRTVYIYDSLSGYYISESIKEIAKSILLSDDITYINVSIPRQPGFVECGYSTLYYAFKLLTVGEDYLEKNTFSEDMGTMSDYLSKKVFEFIRKKMLESMLKALLGKRQAKRAREDIDIVEISDSEEEEEDIVEISEGASEGAVESKEDVEERESKDEDGDIVEIIDDSFVFF